MTQTFSIPCSPRAGHTVYRCPHCSYQPTSREDYCDEHRDAITVDFTTSQRNFVMNALVNVKTETNKDEATRDRLLKMLRIVRTR